MIQANTNNRWARLSQSEKAELLGIYASKGYNDLASIIAHYNACGGKLKADGGPEDVEKPSLKKRVAYRLGSAAKEGAGLTIPGIFEALVSPQKEYDELDAYLNGADKHFEKYNGESNGPIVGEKWEGIPQYKAKINPNGEYLFPEEWRNIIDLAAQSGAIIYQNADKAFEYSPEYRYDAANYPMIIGRSDNGYVVNSADLYDFDKDYADRYTEKNKPLKRALVKAEIGMMRDSGNPYIVREEGIPIRFIGNDASQEEKDLAHQTILGIGKGETGNEFDENTAIDKILNRIGLYTGASSTITEEMPDYLRYSSGGKIHIKPENRGKFTALKKRTGHSASWFKAHGTPAQKKMATFALNSKHWSHKHADGGPLFSDIRDIF